MPIFRSSRPLPLESGASLPEFEIAYEIYGDFSCERAILVCHALSGSAQAAGSQPRRGWWDSMIGPGKPLDTQRWCVVSSNVLGGCGGSTGPSSPHPQDGRPWARRFPVLSVADMVSAQLRLADHLGVECWQAVVGGCLGGAQALTWLQRHPARLRRAVAIGVTAATSAHSLAFFEVLRQSLMLDPDYGDGNYYERGIPTSGMALNARMGMLFWMTPALMEMKFGRRSLAGEYRYTLEPEFAVHEALAALGQGLGDRFDPNTMIYLTRAMDYFDLARGFSSLPEAMAQAKAPVLLVSYNTDWRYPREEVEKLRQALPDARHVTLDSHLGHGAWLFETAPLGQLVAEFLEQGRSA